VKASNPGTVTTHYYDHHSHGLVQFRHVFWPFRPSITGFQFCWPLMSIDDTYLFEKYRGALLIIMGVDADGGLYPLAFAVVEGEAQVAWQ